MKLTVSSVSPDSNRNLAVSLESELATQFRGTATDGTHPVHQHAHTLRNVVICALVFVACLLIAWPVAEIGFNDEWAFVRCAQIFAKTGQIAYDGWLQPMIGWQLVWGALFIRLFGFSFLTLRLSAAAVDLATVALFYLIQVRFGIRPRNAIFGTLTLVLSPLFLPVAASFMTDVPSLFVVLLCLYFCQRAVAAHTDVSTIAWLCLAAASNLAGGTVRQIAWFGALIMVPSTAWFLRKRRGVLPAAVILWAGTLAWVLFCMHWYAAQPYSITTSLFKAPALKPGEPVFVILIVFLRLVFGNFFCLLLVVFPILAAWLPRFRKVRPVFLLPAAALLIFWLGLQALTGWTLPWMPNLLAWEFSSAGCLRMSPDPDSFIFPAWACLIFSALILAAFLILVDTVREQLRAFEGWRQFIGSDPVFWLLAPYVLGYSGLLVLHGTQADIFFDRYLLGLMPMAILVLIRLYESLVAPRLPAISVVALAVFSVLAVAGTHDWFAKERARLVAISELRNAGIPRTEIQGGYEYDGWTQTENGGYLNDPRLVNPPGAYQPNPPVPDVAKPCRLEFATYTPSIHPRYTVAFPPMPCFVPSEFPAVHYHTWLPPFNKTVYVQKIPAQRTIGSADGATRLQHDRGNIR